MQKNMLTLRELLKKLCDLGEYPSNALADPLIQQILHHVDCTESIAAKVKGACIREAGWIFCGADFAALESKVDTLLTRDPMKEVVFTDGFDSHCLASYFYFKDRMPDITDELGDYFESGNNIPKEKAVEIINSIKHRYPALRQDSKAISFASLYGGTYLTLMSNCGLTMEAAKGVEANYHKLYKVSDAWKAEKLKQAAIDGYVTVAFGLRVRTPLLKQVVWGSSKIPREAAAEGRTAGNAMGQSYCMLNSRAMNAFMERVWASKYRHDILPVAQIHDAGYALVRDDPEVVEWANRELIKAMEWQDLPELQHAQVKLTANLDLFWPSWAHATTLPNGADQASILAVCAATKQELLNKEKP